jgi:phosphoribosylformimino-5-aminoimidazole carboxamide ribotide isomerase
VSAEGLRWTSNGRTRVSTTRPATTRETLVLTPPMSQPRVQIPVMRIIGVIDLRDGRAVHARGGHREDYQPVRSRLLEDASAGDATALALAYRRSGVAEIYLADLDAIAGRSAGLSQAAAAISAEWVDAGVRSVSVAEELAACGTRHIVLALETLVSWDLVAEVVRVTGTERTAFSLDLVGGVPLGSLGKDPVALVARAVACGVSAVIVLDLARVGAGAGIDGTLLGAIRRGAPDVELVVGGGIRDARDVAVAIEAGYDGVLVGTALHTGALSVAAIKR